MGYATINPFNERTLKTFSEHDDAHVEETIGRAHSVYSLDWSRRPIEHRKAIVKKAAAILRERRGKLAELVTLEMGKLIAEARAEVDLSADILDYYADNAAQFLAAQPLKNADGEAWVESAPMGVLFCIEPWNFPYYQLARVAGPNLMAGNTLIVKHAPNVPQCALAFAELFIDAGAPAGAYSNLFVSNEQAARIIADPRIIGVALTGSMRAGAAVASEAGHVMKKSTMELGGSDAFIVLEDANLDDAVRLGVWAKMNNTGECCVAAKRFILHEAIADAFMSRFKAELEKLVPGDPMDEATTLGPLCTENALVRWFFSRSRPRSKAERKVLLGGKRIERPGYYHSNRQSSPTSRPKIRLSTKNSLRPVALMFRVQHRRRGRHCPRQRLPIRSRRHDHDHRHRARKADRHARSSPAWCSSTRRPGLHRIFPSAASRTRATDASSPNSVLASS